jgi:hypothetical protein
MRYVFFLEGLYFSFQFCFCFICCNKWFDSHHVLFGGDELRFSLPRTL